MSFALYCNEHAKIVNDLVSITGTIATYFCMFINYAFADGDRICLAISFFRDNYYLVLIAVCFQFYG